MECMYCGSTKTNLNSLKNHQRLCKSNPDRQKTWLEKQYENNGQPSFFTDEHKKKLKEWGRQGRLLQGELSAETKSKISAKIKKLHNTNEYKKLQSNRMKEVVKNNPDSYSKKNISGRVKNIEYEGYIFKGNWELEVGKFLLEYNIKFEQPENPIPYFWNNDWHLYFPDFYLPEYDKFIEVKGYERERDLAKWAVVKNLIIIKHKEIDKIRKRQYSIKELIYGG